MSFNQVLVKNLVSSLSKAELPLFFSSEDSFLREFFLEKGLKHLSIDREDCDFYFGQELKKENLLSMGGAPSLFAEYNQRYVVVLNAENMGNDVATLVKEESLNNIILSFAKKNAFFKDLIKLKKNCLELIPPRFWEYRDYLGQLLTFFPNLSFEEKAKEHFLQTVRQGTYEYFNHLNNIDHYFSLERPGKKLITEHKLKLVIPTSFFDPFYAFDLFLERRFKAFFRFLVGNEEISFDDLRYFAVFMQNQLIKMDSLKKGGGEDSLNKFEKKIYSFSGKWSLREIEKSTMFFAGVEHRSKLKEKSLIPELRAKSL